MTMNCANIKPVLKYMQLLSIKINKSDFAAGFTGVDFGNRGANLAGTEDDDFHIVGLMFAAVLWINVQCLELAIKMGSFHAHYLRQLTNIATNIFQVME